MALDQDSIAHQHDLLASYRRTVAHLLEQAAQYGGEVFAPTHTASGLAVARSEIAGIKRALREAGVVVKDEPNDVPLPQHSFVVPARGTGGYIDWDKVVRNKLDGAKHFDPQQQHNRRRMIDKVESFWVKGVLDQSLYQIARFELGLELDPDAVAHPWETIVQRSNQPRQAVPFGKPTIQVFDELEGEFLILGAPGAGKTTLLLELARDLIARARQNNQYPIPVVFNLSTWVTKLQPLDKWLVEELNQRYDVPLKIAESWVSADKILPLLDGLDEVAEEQRIACVDTINAFRSEKGFVPLVVCSRIEEYHAVSEKLHLEGALIVQPLKAEQVVAYLRQKPLVRVLELLKDDPSLQELLDTPLMLSIVVLAYKDSSPMKALEAETLEQRRERLFDDYISVMFRRRSKGERYTPTQTLEWLGWLACEMVYQSQTVFLVERLQPEWLPSNLVLRLYGLLDRSSTILFLELCYGSLYMLFYSLFYGPLYLLFYGISLQESYGYSLDRYFGMHNVLSSGLIVGLIAALFGGVSSAEISHQRRISNIAADILIGGIIGAFVGGIIGGLTGVLIGGPDNFAVASQFFSELQLGGIVGGLLGMLTGRPKLNMRNIVIVERLRWSLRISRQLILSALAIGLVSGLSTGLSDGLLFGTTSSLSNGLLVGLGSVLVAGVSSAIFTILLAGLQRIEISTSIHPNYGIWRSLSNALVGGFVVGVALGLFDGLFNGIVYGLFPSQYYGGLNDGLLIGLCNGVLGGVLGGLIGGFVFGGYACLSHLILRLLLYHNRLLPFRDLIPFLDYCAERIFLRKVGGGYIFVHRLLMEHFAKLYEEPPSAD